MGIDDRDYMKDRYWEGQGKKPPSRWSFNKAERKAAEADADNAQSRGDKTTWNDKKARRERAGVDDVLPGGASWGGKDRSFDQYDRIAAAYPSKTGHRRGQHFNDRRKTSGNRSVIYRTTPLYWIMAALSVLGVCIPMLGDLLRIPTIARMYSDLMPRSVPL